MKRPHRDWERKHFPRAFPKRSLNQSSPMLRQVDELGLPQRLYRRQIAVQKNGSYLLMSFFVTQESFQGFTSGRPLLDALGIALLKKHRGQALQTYTKTQERFGRMARPSFPEEFLPESPQRTTHASCIGGNRTSGQPAIEFTEEELVMRFLVLLHRHSARQR